MARGQRLQTAIPGYGCLYHPRYTEKGVTKQTLVWWMEYRVRGCDKPQRRSCGTRDQRIAFGKLEEEYATWIKGEIGTTRTAGTVTIGDLLDLMLLEYRENATLANQTNQVERHLRPRWGETRAIDLRRAAVEEWADSLSEGTPDPQRAGKWLRPPLSPASINRMLSSLLSALRCGQSADPPLVTRIPEFPWRSEAGNARQGTISRREYETLRDLLPDFVQLALVIGYHTGMRKGLIMSLRWAWVDLDASVIRIPDPEASNKTKPRLVPIWGEMRAYLEMAQARAQSEFVIERRGHKAADIDRIWTRTCKVAGIRALFHDLRRTAATLMVDDLGLSEPEVMRIVGWKTAANFRRYHIGSEKQVQRLGREMDARMAEKLREAKPITERRQ